MRVQSSVVFSQTREGSVRYTFYFFDEMTDVIALHSHASFAHASIALRGNFEVFDDAGKVVRLNEGQFVEFRIGREHGIRPLTAPAILVSINEPGK